MEDEIDIYADLPNFDLGNDENLVEKNKKITEKCTRLEKQVADLTQSLESMRKVNNNLEVNLSSLLKTAKAEIARKDRMIADIRQQLDNMQFRRGEYSRSIKKGRHSPQRRKRDNNSPPKSNDVIEVAEVPDTTEFVCSNPPPSIEDDDDNRSQKLLRRQLNGAVNTVFGERLRKKILEEQEEEERNRNEQSKARAEIDLNKIHNSSVPEGIAESDAHTEQKAKSLADLKANDIPRIPNTGSSLGSSSSLNSQEDAGLTKRNYNDRKRQPQDQPEPTSSYKKSKTDDGKSRHRERSRRNMLGNHSSSKNSSKIRSEEGNCTERSGDLSKYQIIDEYEAPVENEAQKEIESINAADDDETQYRHNRVAIRLMLLSEGIDPDIEAKKTAENEQSKVVEDKKQGSKNSGETSRSRSKSRNRRHDHRSRSRTPDDRWKKSRESKQREYRQRRKSRDRFERRKESKNKDGDNLSEFSREICDLRDRIEHRVEDRSSDRAGRGKSFKRNKRNDERSHRSGRSRTPDSSRCGSKEKTDHRSRGDKQYGRSRSRERNRSRNRRKQQSDFDDVDKKDAKTVEPVRRKTEDVEIVSTKVLLSKAPVDPETKSLISLEDGEILDSASSSPVKTAGAGQCLTEKTLPSSCKLNLLDSEKLASKIADVECPLPLREIGNSRNNEKSVLVEKPISSMPESNGSAGLNDSLNTSREERIENIAEFIANFSSDVSESKKLEKLNDPIIPNDDASVVVQPAAVVSEENGPTEKIRFILNTVFKGSSTEPLVSSLTETSDSVCAKNVNGIVEDEDWCLIAIDSPIKNFEENRKSRMMAQSLQNTENSEPTKIVDTGDPALEDSNNSSGTKCVDDSQRKIDVKVEEAASLNGTTKPVAQPIKNISKTKPAVITSLRSTYRKRKREIILSDTNSEQCTKISVPNPVSFATKNLGCEFQTGQQSGDDNNKPFERPDDVGPIESKRSLPEVVDLNCNNSRKCNKKKKIDDLFGDQYDSENTADCDISKTNDQLDVATKERADVATVVEPPVDEISENNEKSTAKSIVIEKEITTKIGSGSIKSELCNSAVNESEDKQTTVCNKTDLTDTVGSKSEAVCKVDKTEEENEESNIKKTNLVNKPTKSVPKAKIEGNNSKTKKEPQKLIVIARRRKPVNLEDSLSPSSVVMNQSTISDGVNNSIDSTNVDIEASNSL